MTGTLFYFFILSGGNIRFRRRRDPVYLSGERGVSSLCERGRGGGGWGDGVIKVSGRAGEIPQKKEVRDEGPRSRL